MDVWTQSANRVCEVLRQDGLSAITTPVTLDTLVQMKTEAPAAFAIVATTAAELGLQAGFAKALKHAPVPAMLPPPQGCPVVPEEVVAGFDAPWMHTATSEYLPTMYAALQSPEDLANLLRGTVGLGQLALIVEAWPDGAQAIYDRAEALQPDGGAALAAAVYTQTGVGRGCFVRGTQTEVAECLLRDLQGDSPVPPVFAEWSFWRYVPMNGVWGETTTQAAEAAVQAYDGRAIGRGPKRTRLDVSANFAKGVVHCASLRCHQPTFFDEARRGIVWADVFVALTSEGVTPVPHDPSHRARHPRPFPYDPHAPCPRWIQFLEEVFTPVRIEAGNDNEEDEHFNDARERTLMLQEFLGACLAGLATRYQRALILYGPKGNDGKSVLLKVAQSLFPADALAAAAPKHLSQRFGPSDLVGKDLNTVADIPSDVLEDATELMQVISGDRVRADRKNRDPVTFVPKAAHVFSCNKLPGTKNQTDGFWRRFMVLMMTHAFTKQERDPDLDKKLLAEVPGILAWALAGLPRLLKNGDYTVPPSTARLMNVWRTESDPVRLFFTECCVVPKTADWDVHERRSDLPIRGTTPAVLYTAFTEWAARAGHKPLSAASFRQRWATLEVPTGRCAGGDRTRFIWVVLRKNPQEVVGMQVPEHMALDAANTPVSRNLM